MTIFIIKKNLYNNMRETIKQWLYILMLFLFIIVLLLTLYSYNYIGESGSIPFYLIFFVEYHTLFMFLLTVFGVIFGSATQIMTSKRIESNKEKLDLLIDYFKNTLNSDEREIIDYLIKNKGTCTQYELTKLPNLNKLKVSRLLVDMEHKRLITKEKIGKINKVFLDKKLLEIISP